MVPGSGSSLLSSGRMMTMTRFSVHRAVMAISPAGMVEGMVLSQPAKV